jgi:hypothetical protein
VTDATDALLAQARIARRMPKPRTPRLLAAGKPAPLTMQQLERLVYDNEARARQGDPYAGQVAEGFRDRSCAAADTAVALASRTTPTRSAARR